MQLYDNFNGTVQTTIQSIINNIIKNCKKKIIFIKHTKHTKSKFVYYKETVNLECIHTVQNYHVITVLNHL